LSRQAFNDFRRRLDYTEYGGAILLGVRGVCIIGHGSSNDNAIFNGIRVAAEFGQGGHQRAHRAGVCQGAQARAGGNADSGAEATIQ
jgi:fatty acid/phospholipid biosynthesis enzyme